MKLLLVVPRYPWPPRRGDQLRTVQTLEALSDEHQLTLLAPEPAAGSDPPPRPETFRLVTYRCRRRWIVAGLLRALLSGSPLQSGLYDQPDLRRKLRRLSRQADLAILQLVRLASYQRDFGATPVLVDFIDSLGLNFTHRARFDHPALRPLLALEARRLFRAEGRLLEAARGGVLVCERDRRELGRRFGPESASRLTVVPLAVSPASAPVAAPQPVGGESTVPILAITGNLGYFVNRDAVRWWLEHVWEELHRQRPDVRLLVAGARPPRRLAMAIVGAGGEILASPPDLSAELARATIALAPLRGGSGVPVKILEAWSLGVPVIASPWAAAGAEGRPGSDLLVAETPDDWVRQVQALLEDPAARRRLAAGGRRRLAAHSPESVRRLWLEALRTAV